MEKIEQLDDFLKRIICNIHENITDLLTALLVFSEEELSQAGCAKDLDFSSCMSENQFFLARFYCLNHKNLTESFINNFDSRIPAYNGGAERRLEYAQRAKNKPTFNWH